MFLHHLIENIKNKFITLTVHTLIKEEMEEYIQILIFVGAMFIMIVQQSIKEKKKPKTSPFPEGEILEEVFPDLANNEEIPQPQPSKKSSPKKKRPQPSAKPFKPVSETPAPSSPSKGKIRLSSREEAKRAFIYSEIFNRKY